MRRTLLLIALSFCLLAMPSFSWAGTCPTGTNYLNTTNPTGPLVTLSSLGITNCFYIAANGSDASDGASETSPWAHAPGMPNCTGNCASNKPTGGTGYIFRGGDAWHFGASGSTPYVGASGWGFTWSGSSQSVPIYIGVDPSWYSGGSWARPILTADNPGKACPGTGPCPVSSCPYVISGANDMISFNSLKWVVFDNFEVTGYCWNNGNDQSMIGYYSNATQDSYTPYYLVLENIYIHGWTHTSAAGTASGMEGNSSWPGVVIQFNVVDGQDSDDLYLSALGANNTDLYIVRYNILRRFGGDIVSSSCHYFHDNLIEYYNLGTGHGDAPFCEGEYSGGSSSPNLFFDNIWRYIGTAYNQAVSYIPNIGTPSGQTDYIFNNVWHDNQPNGTNYLSDEDRAGNWVLFNNTVEMLVNGAGCFVCATGSAVTSVNNHWIATPASQSSVFTSTPKSDSGTVYMTNATAATQGYTSSDDYAPTAATNATVTASGTNETSGYCSASVLGYSIAEAACIQGTSLGCSYNTTTHTVSCPAVARVARPSSGNWNAGAYQYGTGVQPAPPYGLGGTITAQ
jgi:hypothetical protein